MEQKALLDKMFEENEELMTENLQVCDAEFSSTEEELQAEPRSESGREMK